ncbi:hypothetical protein [Desulfovibrio intestinalis]|uniref:Uncharacterized protein n=1 Tax=Desulfovibrio intestinalis TaxID=58621 RepID=A0A7W8C3Z4_9BACT|nr:hypothetical protein [Desulfovibrio intestinalis]MBB5143949.1 hypothetical protein [Desulfovibrio intestinalis]
MNDIITPGNPAPEATPPASDPAPQNAAPAPAAPPAAQPDGNPAQPGNAEAPAADWKATLPESWRDMLKDAADEESARKILERGLNYNPAASPDDVALTYPDGLQVDEAVSGDFKRFCVDNGITASQAQALLDWQIGASKQIADTVIANGQSDLRGKWGHNYDANTAQALKTVVALDRHMGGRLAETLAFTNMNNNPVLVEAFHHIGQLISEDQLSSGQAATSPDKAESAEETYKSLGFK